jgi:GPH family glycoside/pentoside/hexuronide:cation symporter
MSEQDGWAPQAQEERPSLTTATKIFYALPRLAVSLFSLHISSKVRKYYTDGEPDIQPATLAMLVAVLKCADLFISMAVGYYSDNCTSSYGRRKPFIGAGAPVWSLCVIMLCLAPGGMSATAYIWYFGFFYFMYYSVGWSLTNIPYDALAMELTTDYEERASLFGYKGSFQMVGIIIWGVTGMIFAETYPNDVKKQILISGIIFSVVVILCFLLLLKFVEEPNVGAAQELTKQVDPGVVPSVRRMLRNPVYINYLLFKAPSAMAFEIPVPLVIYYVQYAIRHTNPNAVQSMVVNLVVGGSLLAIPLVVKLCKTFEKSRVLWAFFLGYGCVLLICSFIPPTVFVVYALGTAVGFAMAAGYVIPDSILGDCIDYDEFHTGYRSESTYTVIETNLQQFMEVPSYVIPFTVLGLAGYLSNGGCGCGCGYGEGGCINAPLAMTIGNASRQVVWQSAEVIEAGDSGYDTAVCCDGNYDIGGSCGDSDIYTRLHLDKDMRCRPFTPADGGFAQSCEVFSQKSPVCDSTNGVTFSRASGACVTATASQPRARGGVARVRPAALREATRLSPPRR